MTLNNSSALKGLFSPSTPHSSNAKHLKLLQVWFVWLIQTFLFHPPSVQTSSVLSSSNTHSFQTFSWHLFQCPFSIPSLVWLLAVKLTQFFRSFSCACSCICVQTPPWGGQFLGLEIGVFLFQNVQPFMEVAVSPRSALAAICIPLLFVLKPLYSPSFVL